MNTIATLDVPVVPKALYGVRTDYLRKRLPLIRPRREPKPIVTSTNLFLRSLPPACIDKLDHALRTVSMVREQYLWGQGEIPDYVYFPETAVISHQKVLDDGRMVEVALTGREGSAGIASVFGSGLSPTSAQVVHAGVAVRIERDLLVKLMRVYPELAPPLLAEIGPYINNISQHSICNMYHDVKQRLATWLLMIHDRCQTEILSLTHEQIARSLGIYRPTATGIALELRKDGAIQYGRGAVTILDRQLLESDACSCYRRLPAFS